MNAAGQDFNRLSHPVDLMEHIACVQDWAFERSSEDELTISVAGNWCDYHISFNWRDDLESLHMACAFDFKVPKTKIPTCKRCYRPGLKPANAIIKHSSSWFGRASAPKKRSPVRSSRPKDRLEFWGARRAAMRRAIRAGRAAKRLNLYRGAPFS